MNRVWITCAKPVDAATPARKILSHPVDSHPMGFSSGSVSMRRFAVLGDQPKVIEQSLLDQLTEHALVPSDDGVPPEIEYGWWGGRHVLDSRFDFERNVFNDAISFAMRVDTSRVPAELRQAYKIMEEDAGAAA